MQDILSYGKAPTEPTEAQAWAVKKIQEYQYRKMFHLSEQEFLNESLESFSVNMSIKEAIDKKENREMKKASKKSRR